jgi:hypothetical protein
MLLMFARAGILFVVREVLPVAASWRYEKPGEREQILQLSLAAVLQYVTAVPEGDKIDVITVHINTLWYRKSQAIFYLAFYDLHA